MSEVACEADAPPAGEPVLRKIIHIDMGCLLRVGGAAR